jgi:myo-inositol-1(or 4)-monophosphatase
MGDLLDDLLALATNAAQHAAELIVDGRRLDAQGALAIEVSTKSTPTDMVTEMDRAAEALIVRAILDARTDDGIVGEEGANHEGTSGVQWFVDPIDGTTNYLYGFPGFAVSIGVAVDGEMVAGVVHDPLHREVHQAIRGRGATRNGSPMRVNDHGDLATALVATGFAYDPARRARQAAVLEVVLPRVRDVRRMGAASVDLCSVGCGRVDAYYERGLSPWDLAAGVLVATEAGAVAGDLDGGPPSGAFVLVTAPRLFEPLADLLLKAGAGSA